VVQAHPQAFGHPLREISFFFNRDLFWTDSDGNFLSEVTSFFLFGTFCFRTPPPTPERRGPPPTFTTVLLLSEFPFFSATGKLLRVFWDFFSVLEMSGNYQDVLDDQDDGLSPGPALCALSFHAFGRGNSLGRSVHDGHVFFLMASL